VSHYLGRPVTVPQTQNNFWCTVVTCGHYGRVVLLLKGGRTEINETDVSGQQHPFRPRRRITLRTNSRVRTGRFKTKWACISTLATGTCTTLKALWARRIFSGLRSVWIKWRSCKTTTKLVSVKEYERKARKLTCNTVEQLSGKRLNMMSWKRGEVVVFQKIVNAHPKKLGNEAYMIPMVEPVE